MRVLHRRPFTRKLSLFLLALSALFVAGFQAGCTPHQGFDSPNGRYQIVNVEYHEGIMHDQQDIRKVTLMVDTWTGDSWRFWSGSGAVYEWVHVPVSPIKPQALELAPPSANR